MIDPSEEPPVPTDTGPTMPSKPAIRRRVRRPASKRSADYAPKIDQLPDLQSGPASVDSPENGHDQINPLDPATIDSRRATRSDPQSPQNSDDPAETAPRPRRRRGRRIETTQVATEAESPGESDSETKLIDEITAAEPASDAGPRKINPRRRQSNAAAISPHPDATTDISFMHPSEREFAALLDYYRINYLYEPRSFPLRWNGDRVVEMFNPDFYLPEYDQYFELTTMKQSLVTQKNRKLRQVKELYPEINIQLLYRRDLMRLMGKYGFGPLADVSVEGTERVLFSQDEVETRVKDLGAQITNDYQGQEPVLIGVLRGVVVFMADLMRHVDLPIQVEFMEISHYGEERGGAIDIIRDVGTDIAGRDVLVVEDIVDTGMTLRYLLDHLRSKQPNSIKVCTLLDKNVRRVADIHLDYVGFEIPDEFIIGYGLDYGGRYRNLPYIGALKPIEPKAVPQR